MAASVTATTIVSNNMPEIEMTSLTGEDSQQCDIGYHFHVSYG